MRTRKLRSSALVISLLGSASLVVAVGVGGCRPAPELPREVTEPVLTLGGFQQDVTSVAYSPDGSLLAAAESHFGKNIKVWETATGKEVLSLELKHDNGVGMLANGVAFSPDGKRLLIASGTKQVRDARTGEAIFELERKGTGIQTAAYSPNGRWIAVGGSRRPSVHPSSGRPHSPAGRTGSYTRRY